jgi:uncharacterized protein
MLKEFWRDKIRFNWIFGLVLILVLGIPRFFLVLHANVTGKFHFISLIFIVMWILPFVFLSKNGRMCIGMVKAKGGSWLLYSFLSGAACSLIVYGIGVLLYQDTTHNWFVYLAKPFERYGHLQGTDKLILFVVSSIISMTFSPIGEELLYRGLVHSSFQEDIGDRKASYIDSLAFALTHLAHFGIVYVNGEWDFLLLPSLLWMLLMFFASRLFFYCKQQTDSLLGAIVSHAAFNLAMMFLIFYCIM